MVRTLRQRLDFIGPFDWAIMGILLGLFIGAVFGSRAAHAASIGVDWYAWLDGFLQNSGTEMLGAFLTFVLLELVRGSREKREQEEIEEKRTQETQKLIRGFVQSQEIARLRAAQTSEERQPILDGMNATGLLEEAFLFSAQLTGARLFNANLIGSNLMEANLEEASLDKANLEEAMLDHANLANAHLIEANLKEASLLKANLAGSDLDHANLEGANLGGANLAGANFEGATLPDGTELPGRTPLEKLGGKPEPDWRTPFEVWDKAGRPSKES